MMRLRENVLFYGDSEVSVSRSCHLQWHQETLLLDGMELPVRSEREAALWTAALCERGVRLVSGQSVETALRMAHCWGQGLVHLPRGLVAVRGGGRLLRWDLTPGRWDGGSLRWAQESWQTSDLYFCESGVFFDGLYCVRGTQRVSITHAPSVIVQGHLPRALVLALCLDADIDIDAS